MSGPESAPVLSIPLGRAGLVRQLLADANAGRTVLLYGPHGVGKTTILLCVREYVRASGRPCAFVRRTERLEDVTEALAAVYLEEHRAAVSKRALRTLLRDAIEERPGVLLVDDVRAAGTALKGFLRALEGTGLGTIFAADAENDRDHGALRALRLAYREVKVPPLSARQMKRLVEFGLSEQPRFPIGATDRIALVDIAAGRPGMLQFLLSCLGDARFWRGDRLRVEHLRCEAAVETGRAYVHAPRAAHSRVPRACRLETGDPSSTISRRSFRG